MNDRPQLVEPSTEELDTLHSAIRHAQRCGVRFSPKVVEIYWVAPPLTARGAPVLGATDDLEHPIRVYLKRGLPLGVLFRVALHELSHCWDAVCWRESNHVWDLPGLSHDEGERRAERFVAFAMAPLDALSRGEVPQFPLPQWGTCRADV